MKKKLIFFLRLTVISVLFTGIVTSVFGQQSNISGKVTSDSGESMPGVTVMIKGTQRGTITDIDGNYTLNANPSDVLVFSFIGMKTVEVALEGKTKVDVVLENDVIGLEEVVAIGYGIAKKSDLTGAVSSVSKEVLAEQPSLKVEHALQGRVPGVLVQRAGGDVANDNLRIRIRGVNSLTGDNNPLVVIDGMAGGNLGAINPADIESMEVLQDASATAIYGSRGSNGVILIKTKSGKSGKMEVGLNTSYGWDFMNDRVDLLTAIL